MPILNIKVVKEGRFISTSSCVIKESMKKRGGQEVGLLTGDQPLTPLQNRLNMASCREHRMANKERDPPADLSHKNDGTIRLPLRSRHGSKKPQ